MTKEAIRKREYRANKESKEIADNRRAKDNEATKKKNDLQTNVQKKARNEANKLNMRANRDAKKLTNPQNEAPEEFQRIQTPPRALTLKNQNSSVSKTLSHYEMPSGNSIVEDELSEYEKIRLSNIQEKNQKFQELFGHTAKVQKRSLPKSGTNSESSDEDILGATLEPTRRQPKRHCNSQPTENVDCTSSDSSFEAHIDDLVDTAIVEIEDANVVVNDAISHLISSVFVSEVKRPKMKRNTNLGRKTKDTVRKATERYE